MFPRILASLPAALLFATVLAASGHELRAPDLGRPIGTKVELLSVPYGSLDAQAAWMAGGYRPSTAPVPNLGISGADHWMRVEFVNRTGIADLVASIPYWEIDEFEAFAYRSGRLERIALNGQEVPGRDRIGGYPELAFDLHVPGGARTSLLLRFHGEKQVLAPLSFGTATGLLSARSDRSLFIGAFAGIMIFLVLYNFFVYLSMRDPAYLYYVLYILTLCFAQLSLHGVGQAHLWPDSPWFASHASVLFTLASMLFAGIFIHRFLGVRTLSLLMDRALRGILLIIAATLIAYLAGVRLIGYQLAQVLSGTYSLLLLALAVHALRNGSRAARFFLAAWGFFLAGVVVYILRDMGVLPWTTLTTYSIPLGSLIEGVLLSFALADRINVLRRDKERSQAEALSASLENQRIVREQNVVLEEKVQQRTQALQESNEHLKRTQSQLVSAEKMAALGQLTAGIAHEINNPINFITSNIQPLRRNITEIVEVIQAYRALTPETASTKVKELKERERALGLSDSIDELDDIIGSIAEGSKRTAEIVRGLRNFSRLDEDDLVEIDLHEGLRSTLALLGPQIKDKVDVRFLPGDLPRVECYPGKVNQVFMNVLNNAIQATLARAGGPAALVEVTTSTLADHVRISISDNGIGMNEDVKSRMFDPFFTTKPVGDGTGLGLAIVFGIIQEHQGHIDVVSEPGRGTTMCIHLPVKHHQLNQKRA